MCIRIVDLVQYLRLKPFLSRLVSLFKVGLDNVFCILNIAMLCLMFLLNIFKYIYIFEDFVFWIKYTSVSCIRRMHLTLLSCASVGGWTLINLNKYVTSSVIGQCYWLTSLLMQVYWQTMLADRGWVDHVPSTENSNFCEYHNNNRTI